jgi:hypothetical protein
MLADLRPVKILQARPRIACPRFVLAEAQQCKSKKINYFRDIVAEK